jgi:hypothetical protein
MSYVSISWTAPIVKLGCFVCCLAQVCIYKGFCVKEGHFAIIMKLYSCSLAARIARHPGKHTFFHNILSTRLDYNVYGGATNVRIPSLARGLICPPYISQKQAAFITVALVRCVCGSLVITLIQC